MPHQASRRRRKTSIAIVYRVCVAIRSSKAVPLVSLHIVLRHAMSVVVHDAQVVLCINLTFFCCTGEPFGCLCIVLRHALTTVVRHPQRSLRDGVALFSSFTIPLGRLDKVLLHGVTFAVMPSEVKLSRSIAFFSRSAIFLKGICLAWEDACSHKENPNRSKSEGKDCESIEF